METEWRCRQCDTLLGVKQDRRIYLRYKQMQYIIDGGDFQITAVCRNCSSINDHHGGREPPVPILSPHP